MSTENNTISAFLFENEHVRGQIVKLDNELTSLLDKHNYPEPIEKLLSESIACLMLLNGIIKYQGQMTLQFKTKKEISLLLVKCNHLRQFRAYAEFDTQKDYTDDLIKSALSEGQLVLTIEQDNNTKPYQSIVPLIEGNLTLSLEHYFAQSEQLPTRLWIAYQNRTARGILIQQMPDATELKDREDFWQSASLLGETVTTKELLELDNQTLLFRLYHEHGVRLFSPQPLLFNCPCSQEKMAECLKVLGYEDAKELIKTEERIDVGCQFCQTHYYFDSIDVEMIFKHNG